MNESIRYQWLGGAGVLLESQSWVLAVDPFFARPGFGSLFFGRPQSNKELGKRLIPRCDFILVTHSHYDHLMDVPVLAKRTGALVLGSSNTCQICETLGVAKNQIRIIQEGDVLEFDQLCVEVLGSYHGPTPLDFILNRPLHEKPHIPLRLMDYRKDHCFGFLVHADGQRFLFGTEPREADCWFFYPMYTRIEDLTALGESCPKVLVPIHWDDMFRPLDKGIRPGWELPHWKPPFLYRTDLDKFLDEVHNKLPGVEIQVPEAVC